MPFGDKNKIHAKIWKPLLSVMLTLCLAILMMHTICIRSISNNRATIYNTCYHFWLEHAACLNKCSIFYIQYKDVTSWMSHNLWIISATCLKVKKHAIRLFRQTVSSYWISTEPIDSLFLHLCICVNIILIQYEFQFLWNFH